MKMKITCPCDPSHKTFEVIVHEAHILVVDEGGELVNDKGCSEVNHHPSSDDYYVCSVCGEKAKVVKVE